MQARDGRRQLKPHVPAPWRFVLSRPVRCIQCTCRARSAEWSSCSSHQEEARKETATISLSSHLKNASSSPIGQYVRDRFPNTRAVTATANARLRAATCALPGCDAASYPYALIGMAVDYRLRYFFAVTPIYELVAWRGAQLLSEQVWWPQADLSRGRARSVYYAAEELEAFFAALEEDISTLRPVGRLLSAQEDALLARHCFVLSLLEQVFRSGMPSELLFSPAVRHRVQDLLAIADEVWIADICQIGRLFYQRHAGLLSRPFRLNPTFQGSFDVGGADADLIADGCLIDVKTTKSATLDVEWLRQLIGYALLDYEDELGITSVGLYLARHGELFTWPLDVFLRTLSNDSTATTTLLRAEFRAICERSHARTIARTGGSR